MAPAARAADRSSARRSACRSSPGVRSGSSASAPAAPSPGCSASTSRPCRRRRPSARRASKAREIGSQTLTFEPAECRGGEFQFAVGTAGSATLVLQTVLVPLALAASPSTLVLEGGTHNPFAPPFDFLVTTFLPVVNRMGPAIEAQLVRHGFYPAGGGRFVVTVTPAARLQPVDLLDREGEVATSVRVLIANVPFHVAEREIAAVRRRLEPPEEACRVEQVRDSAGPGNVVMIELRSDNVTEVVTGFGEKGVSAEKRGEPRRRRGAGLPAGRRPRGCASRGSAARAARRGGRRVVQDRGADAAHADQRGRHRAVPAGARSASSRNQATPTASRCRPGKVV